MDRIFVLLDPEVEALLADNEIDLVQELRNRGVEVQGRREADPTRSGERDLVLVILASGVAFATVSWGITQIINALGRNRGATIKAQKLVPVLDGEGKPVLGPDGKPLMEWHEMKETQPPAPRADEAKLTAEGIGGVMISLSSRSAPAMP